MRRPVCIIGLAFVFIFLLYLFIHPPTSVFPTEWEGTVVTLTGQVEKKEYRVSNGKRTIVIYMKDIRFVRPDTLDSLDEIRGILFYGEEEQEPRMGSIIRVRGKLRDFAQASNPGEFDAQSYYRILNLQARLLNGTIIEESREYDRFRESLWEVRQYCAARLDACYEAEDASILKAMLLGEKGELDEEIKRLYQQNGIIHILSISGLHISIIGMGVHKFLRKIRCPMPVNILFSIVFMYCYGMMTGMSVSAVRAIMMFGFRIGAVLFGRTYDMLTAVSFAGMTVLIPQPLYLYHSGFLFSFGAVLAIGLAAPIAEEVLFGKNGHGGRKPRKSKPGHPESDRLKSSQARFHQTIAANVSVSLVTFPVYLCFYYEYPLYSLLLNFLIIPGTSLLVAGGFVSLLVSVFCLPLAKRIALLPHFLLAFYKYCCQAVLCLPAGRNILGKPNSLQIVIFALLLCAAFFFGSRWGRRCFLPCILLALLCITLRFQSGLQITVLDVGQGDGIYLADGQGGHYLIDGGSTDKSDVGTYQMLPFLKAEGVKRLDAVFVTHMDSDHYNGIRTLIEQTGMDGIPIKMLVLPDVGEESREEPYEALEELARQQGIEVAYLHKGGMIQHGKLKLTCLHPEKGAELETNAASLVLYLEYEAFTALFTGDLEGMGEESVRRQMEELLPGQSSLTMLKVAHHGSRNSTGTSFLETVSPQIALISAGKNNRYGHPHEELLQRLGQVGSSIYTTQEGGAVTVTYRNGKAAVRCFLKE